MLCVFDVNETLLDLAALDEFFTGLTGTAKTRTEWFNLVIQSALTLTAARRYRPFGEIGAASLVAVAARHGRMASPDDQRELARRMRELPPHPDAAEAIRALRDAGSSVVTLTNNTREVADDQMRAAGLRDLLDGVYSVHDAGLLKPAPEAYQHVLRETETSPGDAVMIAAHNWDVAGAAAAGMRTALIARHGESPLPTHPEPTWTVPSLGATADALTR